MFRSPRVREISFVSVFVCCETDSNSAFSSLCARQLSCSDAQTFLRYLHCLGWKKHGKRKAIVAGASLRDQEIEEQDQTNKAISGMHSMLSSSGRSSPSCSNTVAPEKRLRSTKPSPAREASTPAPPSFAVQAKINRLRTSLHNKQKMTTLKPSTTHPGHVVITSPALLAAVMTFHADWEMSIDPAQADVKILKDIVAEGLSSDEGGSLEEWWKRKGDVVVDLTRSGELSLERDVRGRLGACGLGEEVVGILLSNEVEEYYRRVGEYWDEGRWRWYGAE